MHLIIGIKQSAFIKTHTSDNNINAMNKYRNPSSGAPTSIQGALHLFDHAGCWNYSSKYPLENLMYMSNLYFSINLCVIPVVLTPKQTECAMMEIFPTKSSGLKHHVNLQFMNLKDSAKCVAIWCLHTLCQVTGPISATDRCQ